MTWATSTLKPKSFMSLFTHCNHDDGSDDDTMHWLYVFLCGSFLTVFVYVSLFHVLLCVLVEWLVDCSAGCLTAVVQIPGGLGWA
jgi:hypothetical protein